MKSPETGYGSNNEKARLDAREIFSMTITDGATEP
jgi:hypothetical protein